MKVLEKDEKRYKQQFGRYIAAKIKPGDLEKIYSDVHKAIRKDPVSKSKYAKLKRVEKKKARTEDIKKKERKVIFIKKINFKRKKSFNCWKKNKNFSFFW